MDFFTDANGIVHPIEGKGGGKSSPLIKARIEEFPKTPDLPDKKYPNVEKTYKNYVDKILGDVNKNGGVWEYPKFIANFRPNGAWDIKGDKGIPPAGSWAFYKGEKVHDAYLANNIFGQAMAKLGESLESTLWKAQEVANWTLPSRRDQPEDQAAIVSGYYEYKTGNPWPKGLRTPDEYHLLKEKYPDVYRKELFRKQLSFKKLIDAIDD
ncbi:MAG: hypothetical protein VKJ06_09355 [Vampirovibrionales bacterium]|nr:hypothetical protein [Vampirovibrionales bacterium]